MNNSDLIKCVALECSDLTPQQARDFVGFFFETMKKTLQNGHNIELRGFGSFVVRKRAARQGNNPKTGRAISIPSRLIPLFRAGKQLREWTNRYKIV